MDTAFRGFFTLPAEGLDLKHMFLVLLSVALLSNSYFPQKDT